MSDIDFPASNLSSKILPEINRKRVLKLIYTERALTRREIADNLLISQPTVSKIVDGMLEEGLVTEGGRQESTGGRKPRLITFAPTSRVAVGVDITMEGLRFVIADLWGYIGLSKRYKLPFENSDAYWDQFVRCTEEFIELTTLDKKTIIGVGITLSGVFSKDKPVVEYSFLLNVQNMDLSFLQDRIPYPLLFSNDAYAAGYAEQHNSSRLNLAFYLSISDGISGAIMIQNELFTGYNNRAGSVGHIIIEPQNGKPCICGKRGCLEAYCSTRVLTEPFGEPLPMFFSALNKREPKHVEIWNTYMDHLVIGLSSIRQMLDIAIIIGGEIAPYIADYMPDLFERMGRISSFPEKSRLYINAAHFGKDASALGVALQLVKNYLDI